MRKILDQMEQLRWLTESPLQKMIEQQERLFRLAESPIEKMIEQENEQLRLIEQFSGKFPDIAELQQASNLAQDALGSHIQQMIDQQERFRGIVEQFSKQMEALNPAMNDIAKLSGLAEHSLQPSLSTIAEQLTGLDPVMREMQRQQSLISAIENPTAEWFRNQNMLEALCREIERPQAGSIEPLRIPFPRPKRRRKRSAELFFKQVIAAIRKVEEKLLDDECLVIYCHTEAGEIIFIQRIAYQNPNLIILYGFDTEGHDHHIVAHMKTVRLDVRVEKNPDSEKGKSRWIQ